MQSGTVPPVDRLLLEVSDVVNTTLDLDTTLRRVAEVVRKIVDFEIFAILLLNEKNKVIGVIDIESPQPNHFTEEHKQVLTLIASRVAVHIENARLYTRTSRQAKTLLLLNEIARELTSILNLDDVLKRVGELLSRLID